MPAHVHPIAAVAVIYVLVLVLCAGYLLATQREAAFYSQQIQSIGWAHGAVAVSVLLVELGFMLMYRFHWDLSVGTVVTGVFVNLILLGIGWRVLGESLSPINVLGVLCCAIGVGLLAYK